MIYYSCLHCSHVEKTTEFVPELIHAHEGSLFRLIAFHTPEEAERYALVTSDRWKSAPEGLAKFLTADGGEQWRCVRMPPAPYMDFAIMPAMRASLELEGSAPFDHVQVRRRRYEYVTREPDGTVLYREVLGAP